MGRNNAPKITYSTYLAYFHCDFFIFWTLFCLVSSKTHYDEAHVKLLPWKNIFTRTNVKS